MYFLIDSGAEIDNLYIDGTVSVWQLIVNSN